MSEAGNRERAMTSIEGTVLDFKRLDLLATGDSAIHRLDARAKVLVTLVFIVSVISFNRYELTPLLPFFIFPLVMVAQGNLPPGYMLQKVAVVIPFALFVGIMNPLFDREIMWQAGSIGISGGWISCISIIVRAVLTVGAALVLVGVSGFPAICRALERLGVPQAFAVQLHFLYRYIFVLTDEGSRAARARELRSFGTSSLSMKSYSSLLSHLLLKTWQRAERIHMAMLARGFNGEFHARQHAHFGRAEFLYLFGWSSLFLAMRLGNPSQRIGSYITGMFS